MVTFMPWKSDYVVGEGTIDAQHKRIVGLINKLYIHLQTRRKGDLTKVQQVLNDLVFCTTQHVEYEERLMQESGYPDLESHKSLHIRMMLRTTAMRNNVTLVTDRDMLFYLRDWWDHHLLEEDKAYASHLALTASAHA